MPINWDDNKLTEEVKASLKQGTKVKFKWHGNSELEYIGRIEVDKFEELYFVNEFNYENNEIKPVFEGMRYYNSLKSFYHFTMFEVIT